MKNAIKGYLRNGWAIIPLKPASKLPAVEWDEWKIMRPDVEQWVEWWRQFSGNVNIAVVLGACETPLGTQLVCVDTDSDTAEAWVAAQRELPPTPTAATAKGFHRYYLAPAGLQHFGGSETRPEVRAGDHYCVLPPSVHPSGGAYRWQDGLSPQEVELAELPEWGVTLMRGETREAPAADRKRLTPDERARQYALTALGREVAEVTNAVPGGRNSSLNAAAYSLGQLVGGGLLDEQEVRQALIGASFANGLLKDDGQRAVERTIDSGLKAGKLEPRTPQVATPQERPEPPALPTVDPETGEVLEAQVECAVNAVVETAPKQNGKPVPPGRLDEIAGEMIGAFEEYRTMPRQIVGLRSGFPTIDWHFLGFSRFPLIVLQGQSGYGKTTFAKHCIFSTALAEQQSVEPAYTIVFMLESSRDELLSSYLGYRWGLPREVREPGSEQHLTPELDKLMVRGYAEFPTLPIIVYDDEAIRHMDEIEYRIRRDAERYPLAGVVVDHAQEVEVNRMRSKPEEVSEVSRRFRNLHEALKVPCMLISQTTMTKEGNFETQWSGDLRKKSWLCLAVDRGEPGMKREQAVQSNVMRVINDKARGWPVCPPVTLCGDWRTGRLWEPDDYAVAQGQTRNEGRAADWPGNE